jgi:CHRD domain
MGMSVALGPKPIGRGIRRFQSTPCAARRVERRSLRPGRPEEREERMTRRRFRLALGIVLVLSLAGASFALADKGHGKNGTQFRAKMIGYSEVPSLNTPGHAELSMTVENDTTIKFTLTYADLTGPPAAAHIHVGQQGVNGGVSIFFCGGGGQAACPASNSGTVTGTATAANVVGPIAQGFNAGELAPVLAAMRAGVTYANMHTARFPAGEIRGQIRRGHGDDH